MMAAVLIPKKLVATNIANCARLAAITGGGTVAANAVSNAEAAAVGLGGRLLGLSGGGVHPCDISRGRGRHRYRRRAPPAAVGQPG